MKQGRSRILVRRRKLTDQIIQDMAVDYSKEPVKDVRSGMSGLWVALLALFAAPVALPLLFAGMMVVLSAVIVVWALLLALLVTAGCAVIAGPFTIIAGFSVLFKSFPVFLCCIGIGLLSTGAGAALTYGTYLLCRRSMSWTLRILARMIRRENKRHG